MRSILDEPRAPTCMQPRIDMIELRSGNSDVGFGLFELLDYSESINHWFIMWFTFRIVFSSLRDEKNVTTRAVSSPRHEGQSTSTSVEFRRVSRTDRQMDGLPFCFPPGTGCGQTVPKEDVFNPKSHWRMQRCFGHACSIQMPWIGLFNRFSGRLDCTCDPGFQRQISCTRKFKYMIFNVFCTLSLLFLLHSSPSTDPHCFGA